MVAGHKPKSWWKRYYVSVEAFLYTGWNITTDNLFTSVILVENLILKQYNSKNREQVLSLFEREILKYDRCTLTIYQEERNYNFLLLITLQDNADMDLNHPKKKPETIWLQCHKVWCGFGWWNYEEVQGQSSISKMACINRL